MGEKSISFVYECMKAVNKTFMDRIKSRRVNGLEMLFNKRLFIRDDGSLFLVIVVGDVIPDGVVVDKLPGGLSDTVLSQELSEYIGEHYTPVTNVAHDEDPVLIKGS